MRTSISVAVSYFLIIRIKFNSYIIIIISVQSNQLLKYFRHKSLVNSPLRCTFHHTDRGVLSFWWWLFSTSLRSCTCRSMKIASCTTLNSTRRKSQCLTINRTTRHVSESKSSTRKKYMKTERYSLLRPTEGQP